MNPSPLFRSRLMQQFAAAARTQSRPPLALAGSSASVRKESTASSNRSRSIRTASASSRYTNQSAPTSSSCAPSNAALRHSAKVSTASVRTNEVNDVEQTSNKLESANSTTRDPAHSEVHSIDPSMILAQSMQSVIQSRRTASKFSLDLQNSAQLKDALDRAVLCAQAAPNHYRTEPFSFKRIMAPSNASFRLSEIASRVVYQKNLLVDPDNAQSHADRKRMKWNQIPAFVVTVVNGNQENATSGADHDEYTPMDYKPPATERQLEDYASACAAIQNALLSLHSEGIGTKWATGPVVRTRAFRELIGCQPTDRVAGLIMAGYIHHDDDKPSSSTMRMSKRRYRKSLDDLIQDL